MIKKLTKSVKKAGRKYRHWRKRARHFNKLRKKYKKQIDSLINQRISAYERFEARREALEDAEAANRPNETKIKRLRVELAHAHEELDEISAKIEVARGRLNRALSKLKEVNAKARWWAKKKTIYRKRLREAKKKANPEYESWMANGYDDNVTPACRKFVAIGVVKFDLTTTSMRRNYVPPGGSPTSYHLTNPGKAVDLAGTRMGDFQNHMYSKFLGNSNCLELFGPNNTHCLKYGGSMSLIEGDALETLHDTHVHGAFN